LTNGTERTTFLPSELSPRSTTAAKSVSFTRVSKTFGSTVAVRSVSLDVAPGEFFSILGPSGCGKTTTLRLLAGFETPDDDGGTIRIGDRVVNHERPYQRDLGMVFQSYALFPHLTVARNVAFGLEQRRVPKSEIAGRVSRALEMVQLDPDTYSRRRPGQLSGGQKQRVALARALVTQPPILLLDEPLGALDLKLRKEMQLELERLNRQLGITFIYVTHDQEEALTMSDRIAVMDNARVAQIGTPAEIYERPRTGFVARFIGESNILAGEVVECADKRVTVKGDDDQIIVVPGARAVGQRVHIAVRPENLSLTPGNGAAAPETSGASAADNGHSNGHSNDRTNGHNRLTSTIEQIIYRGESLHIRLAGTGQETLLAAVRNRGQLTNPVAWQPGQPVQVEWPIETGRLLDEDPE